MKDTAEVSSLHDAITLAEDQRVRLSVAVCNHGFWSSILRRQTFIEDVLGCTEAKSP